VGYLAWIVVGVFALALVAKMVRTLRRDPCLRFLHGFHVSFVDSRGMSMWGEMHLTSQGMQLDFDAVHVDSRDLSKCGVIIFPPELSEMTAVCRCSDGITAEEKARRDRQVRLVLEPTWWIRARRRLGNLGGMLRDAVVDTITLFFGQLGASSQKPVAALAGGQRQVTEIGGALLDLGARAFEPLLERMIGKPVIARIDLAGGRRSYFPGYLAEYNEKYLVIVNQSLEPEESLRVRPGTDADKSDVRLIVDDGRLRLESASDDAVVVKRIVGRDATLDVGAVLLAGSTIAMHLPREFDVRHAEVDRTRRLDFVCPRARSQVRFSSTRPPINRDHWAGIGPAG
jgi:hypothetical protein